MNSIILVLAMVGQCGPNGCPRPGLFSRRSQSYTVAPQVAPRVQYKVVTQPRARVEYEVVAPRVEYEVITQSRTVAPRVEYEIVRQSRTVAPRTCVVEIVQEQYQVMPATRSLEVRLPTATPGPAPDVKFCFYN